jgi:hypothetical protein
MDCRDAQDLLLQDEDPSAGELADHVARCGACRRLHADLARLDAAWRALPLPEGVDRARDAFLERLASADRPATPERRRRSAPRWLVAASLLAAVGVGASLLVGLPRASASPDVVDRLVDWNLELARAASPEERTRIYADRAPELARAVKASSLSAEDEALAASLLADAPQLAHQADPLADADRLSAVADKLLKRLNRASRARDARRAEQSARLYGRVVELGIDSKLALIEQSGALDFERQRRLERLVLSDADRMRDLVALLERAPDSSRKEIKRALKLNRDRPKKERRGGKKGTVADPAPGPR